ncbi:MAG: hypothetical protein ACFE96_00720 [Candidatus Hermodarchaeota archaeon]
MIRDLVEGKIQAKHVKQSILQYRRRIVEDISSFLSFYIDRVQGTNHVQISKKESNLNLANLEKEQLHKEIAEKNELLEIVAHKVNNLVSKTKDL